MSEPAPTFDRRVVLGLCAAWVLVLIVVFASRVGFALELEWMEGGMLHQALRLQRGESIYPPPSRDFVPFLYTPGYAVVLAGLGSVFGLSLTLGRVVSIAAWAAIGLGLWRAVGREGKSTVHRAVAVGLWCSGYVFTFRWMDVARPDTLYLALTLWGLVLLRESKGDHKKAVVAGLLVALGFWTKQTAATFIVASAVGALIVAPRQLVSYAATIAVVDGGGVLLGNWLTEGWLWTYIYELHQTHAFNDERFSSKTWGMFVHAAPFLVVLVSGIVIDRVGRWIRRWRDPDASDESRMSGACGYRGLLFWALMFVTGLLVSALGYSTQWAEPNAFLPGVCFGALFIGVSLPRGGLKERIGLALVAAQLLFSLLVEPMYQPVQDEGWAGLRRSYAWQDPRRTIPSADDRGRAGALRAELESTPGEVLALHRPWWSIIAGGSGHVGSMGIRDVDQRDGRRIVNALIGELRAQRYASVWLEGEPPRWMRPALSGYRIAVRLQDDARVRPMSGWMSEAGVVTPYRRDQVQWKPAAPRAIPAGGSVVADFEDGTLQGFEVEGGFGRRPITGLQGRLPAVGPVGGKLLLSSAGRRGNLAATGTATSPPFVLPQTGRLELLVGTSGVQEGLALLVLSQQDERPPMSIPVPRTRFTLTPVAWRVPEVLAGEPVRLQVVDENTNAAVYLDDLWVVED